MLFWIRLVPVAFFSITALSLIAFQSVEIVHAFLNLFSHKQ
ncbi:hypothetical protein [Priestia koreensis]|nr:hypothetical protein [Priestia koreensis]